MTRLYPLSFHSIYKTKIWGGDKLRNILGKDVGNLQKVGESWDISSVEEDITVVSNGFLAGNNLQELVEIYMGDLVGDKVYEKFGIEFPLLIKFIDAGDNLSVQVHPDDETAFKHHHAYGKTEMWYVIQADPGSEIIIGFKKDVTREEYLEHLRNKTLRDILNSEQALAGDVYYIPPGRIHAIGKGVLLVEIEQNSDITYRIYDWDRVDAHGKSREIHTELALEVMDFKSYPQYKVPYKDQLNRTTGLVQCNYFSTQLIHFDKPVEKDYYELDSFVIYIGIEGETEIEHENGTSVLKMGETLLIPAVLKDIRLIPKGEAKILEVYIK